MSDYCLFAKQETQGYTSNRVLWTLSWFDVNTLDIYQTVIDPTYRNFKRCSWDRIVEDPKPWGIYRNLHRGKGQSKGGFGILDADTVAHFVQVLSLAEISKLIDQREQELANQPQTELFTIDE